MKRNLLGAIVLTALFFSAPVRAEDWQGFFHVPQAAGVETGTSLFDARIGSGGGLAVSTYREARTEYVGLQSTAEMMAAVAAPSAWPANLKLSIGYFDPIQQDNEAVSFSAEYHFGRPFWLIDPFAGVMVTTEGSLYGYAGLGLDLVIADRVAIVPSAAVGAYNDGGGKDLGHWIEFRTGVEVAYVFDNRSRMGVGFYHLSNAGLGSRNPGVEILQLSYSLPLGSLLPN